jgi:CRP/FNR family transcriptional regulator, cyclic AMP receptor protein
MDKKVLQDNLWLAGLPKAAKEELIKVARLRTYAANERVMCKGETADGLYGLLSGEVRVSATTSAGDEIVFTRLLPGQWFGEIAVLDGGTRTHDSHAIKACVIAIIPKKAISDLCQRYIEVYRALVTLLCSHCRVAFSSIDELLMYSPEQRLARHLLLRVQKQREEKISISQQELGALIGISRQSINKILKTWEAKGWIKLGYRGLELTNPQGLAGIAEL